MFLKFFPKLGCGGTALLDARGALGGDDHAEPRSRLGRPLDGRAVRGRHPRSGLQWAPRARMRLCVLLRPAAGSFPAAGCRRRCRAARRCAARLGRLGARPLGRRARALRVRAAHARKARKGCCCCSSSFCCLLRLAGWYERAGGRRRRAAAGGRGRGGARSRGGARRPRGAGRRGWRSQRLCPAGGSRWRSAAGGGWGGRLPSPTPHSWTCPH